PATSGTVSPTRNDPRADATCPVIHGMTAPPSPLMAKTHRDSDGPLAMARTFDRHSGKMGASISPASVALAMLIAGVGLTSSITLLTRKMQSAIVSRLDSEITLSTAGAAARPISSAIQKNEVAIGA